MHILTNRCLRHRERERERERERDREGEMAPAGKCRRKRGKIQAVMEVGHGEERTIAAEVSNFGSVKRLKVEHDVDRPVNDECALNSTLQLSLSSSANVKSQHHDLLTCRDLDSETKDLKVKFHSNSFERENINGDVIHGFSRDTSTTPLSETCTETNEMNSLQTCRKSPTGMSRNFNMPTAAEMDEFFSAAEKVDRIKFMKKYNFDVEKDIPVAGNYEWVRIKP